MSRKDLLSLLLGTVGGVLFALGMCMCLLPEWGAFQQGIVLGSLGLVVLLALLLVRRKMAGKPLIRLNARIIGRVLFGVLGALALGVGMCLTMVWQLLLPGIVVGIVGIVLLICLIPLCRGLRPE